MTEETPAPTVTICSWNKHRVFYYALAARLLLSFRFVPSAWMAYLNENAAVRSIVSNPWWTFPVAREILADKVWGENNDSERSFASIFLSLLAERNNVSVGVLLSLIDYWIAHLLSKIVYQMNTPKSEPDLMDRMPEAIRASTAILSALSSSELLSAVLPLLYFANPTVILSSSVYGCCSNIKLLCVLVAIRSVKQPPVVSWVTSVALAIAMCTDVSFGVFGMALSGVWDQMLLVCSILQALFYVSTGHLQIHGFPTAQVTSLPPSLSVAWYTHMEFFTRFAPYLRLLLGYLPYIVFIPLSIRLHRYPMVLVAIFWILVHTLCQPVSTLTDFFVGIILMLLSPTSCARMNQGVVMVAVIGAGVPVTLYLVLHPMWLVSNAGEANFIYFQCLAYQIFVANVGLQFVTASLQRDKALRLTAKGALNGKVTS